VKHRPLATRGESSSQVDFPARQRVTSRRLAVHPQINQGWVPHPCLPHVLVPDLTEAVVEAYLRPGSALDWVGFLSFLDQEHGTGDPYLRGIVEVGFLEQLPYPFEDGHGIVRDLPPLLRSAFRRIRSAG
jgi:hypothetical protein